jgi:hypothetical protein
MSFAVSLLMATASASRTNDFAPSLMHYQKPLSVAKNILVGMKSHMRYLFYEIRILLAHVFRISTEYLYRSVWKQMHLRK